MSPAENAWPFEKQTLVNWRRLCLLFSEEIHNDMLQNNPIKHNWHILRQFHREFAHAIVDFGDVFLAGFEL